MHTFWDALSFCPDHRQCPNNMYFLFLIIKPTRCTSFSHLFLELNFTCFGQLLCPSSGVFYCTHTAMVCIIQVCRQLASRIRMELQFHPDPAGIYHGCVYSENSWWWTEELSETCGVSFQEYIWEISVSDWFYCKKCIVMHGHMTVNMYFLM